MLIIGYIPMEALRGTQASASDVSADAEVARCWHGTLYYAILCCSIVLYSIA